MNRFSRFAPITVPVLAAAMIPLTPLCALSAQPVEAEVPETDVPGARVAPATMQHLQCASVLLVALAGPDIDEAGASGISTLIGYHVGRAEGRSPDADLAAMMPDAVVRTFATEAAFDAVQAECESRSDGFADTMEAIGSAMDRLAPEPDAAAQE